MSVELKIIKKRCGSRVKRVVATNVIIKIKLKVYYLNKYLINHTNNWIKCE